MLTTSFAHDCAFSFSWLTFTDASLSMTSCLCFCLLLMRIDVVLLVNNSKSGNLSCPKVLNCSLCSWRTVYLRGINFPLVSVSKAYKINIYEFSTIHMARIEFKILRILIKLGIKVLFLHSLWKFRWFEYFTNFTQILSNNLSFFLQSTV
jgi:hypothetical protein